MSDTTRSTPSRHIIRYIYPGSTPKNGRVIDLGNVPDADLINVHNELRRDGVDLGRFDVRVHDDLLGGWRRLRKGECPTADCWNILYDGALRRAEIALEKKPQPEASTATPAAANDIDVDALRAPPVGEQNGYFGIGIYNGKNENNLGTLWRSAYQLGASFAFVIGSRYRRESSDTPKSWTQIPAFEYEDWNDFAAKSPVGAVWVGVEMGGTPLETFDHPRNAVYILGSEDTGLNTTILRACRHHIALPTIGSRPPSYNVSAAGSIILYDRETKRRAREAKRRVPHQKGREGIDSLKFPYRNKRDE
mmetsp:Transcript_18545/g.53469  ORF Transcript_18545/g.53469 Transcript_18545/m.53469 type:complete len:306 (-) Transcript_18545:122-1039(-)